jgi:hypothetical protein
MLGMTRRTLTKPFGFAVLVALLIAGTVLAIRSRSGSAPEAPSHCRGAASARVDRRTPTFSHPLRITNPRFPRGAEGQTVQLGTEGDERIRFEITSLPDTKVIEWDGTRVETRVTHYVAYTDGRIVETALDFYAQDDAGNVWYFGEDVSNYEEGVVVNHDGTWRAGRDGPPGLIMPARPRVGDVYRPENIPGLVFEEVTVRAVDQTVQGPRGAVEGAVAVRECLMDGTTEDKHFAPDYGEFAAEVKADREAYRVAVAVPADRATGAAPGALTNLVAATRAGDLAAVRAAADALSEGATPPLLLDALRTAVETRASAGDGRAARQADIDLGHAVLDLELPYRALAEVERDRLGLWERQLALDEAAGDTAAVAGDRATLDAIRERIRP